MKLFFCFTAGLLAAAGLSAADYYSNDFEAQSGIRFRAVNGEKWISDRKTAEQQGFLTIRREVLTDQNEGKSHSGVRSFALDVTLDKLVARWGASAMWQGPPLNVPLDKPVYLNAYVLAEELPPDVTPLLSVIFDGVDRQTGKPVKGGSLYFEKKGADPEGWLVFSRDVSELVGQRYSGAVMTGWQLILRAPFGKPFHGQRVRLFLDDVSVTDAPPAVNLSGDAGKAGRRDVISDDPYVVNYTSLYREFPAESVNRLKNSSFELGLANWIPRLDLNWTGQAAQMPDPLPLHTDFIKTVTMVDAPHGSQVLELGRPTGIASSAAVESIPVAIEDGADYTVSFWAKASQPGAVKVNGSRVAVTEKWERHTVNFPGIKPYTRWNGKSFPGRFILAFRCDSGTETVWLDGIQLARGAQKQYHSPGITELAVRPVSRYGLFLPGEKPQFVATVFNGSETERSGTVKFRFLDFRRRTVGETTREFRLPARGRAEYVLDAPAGFRHVTLAGELTSSGQPPQRATTSVAVIPDLGNVTGNDFFASLIAAPNGPNQREVLELNKLAGMKLMPIYHTNYISRAPANWRENDAVWQPLEFLLREFKRYGFTPLVTVYEPIPAFAARDKDGIPVITEKEQREVYDYCFAMAKRFRGRVKYYEIFAEFMKDPLDSRARAVAAVLPHAWKGLKEGDPECVVVACGEDGLPTLLQQLEAHFKLGTLQFMDVLSLHPYGGFDAQFRPLLDRLRQSMAKHNRGKLLPVWGTEAGARGLDTLYYDGIDFETMYYPNFVTELDQAEQMVRQNLIAFGEGMERNATFYLYSGAAGGMDSFSFVDGGNGIRPKTLFPAFANLVERLSGAEPVRRFEQPENGSCGYLFRKDGKLFAAMWNFDPHHKTHPVELPLRPEQLKVFNLVGEPVRPAGRDKCMLELTGGALYFYPQGITDRQFIRALDGMTVRNLAASLSLQDGGTLGVTLANDEGSEATGVIRAGKEVPFRLAPGETKRFDVPLSGSGPLLQVPVTVSGSKGERALEYRGLRLDGQPVELGKRQFVSLYEKAGWRGADDLSATLRASGDARGLSLEVEVRDSLHCTPFDDPAMVWANDALQIAFAQPGGSFLELAVSDTAKGPVIGVTRGAADPSAIRCSFRRDGGRSSYRITIPWEVVAPGFSPVAGATGIRWNLAVSDNDGDDTVSLPKLKGYEKSLQLFPGLVDRKAPAEWGELILP